MAAGDLGEVATEHFLHRRNVGEIGDADFTGRFGVAGEGNYMVIYVKMGERDVIAEARFLTYGCPAAIAAGSALTTWLIGKTLAEARELTAADLGRQLPEFPPTKEHCLRLAVNALQVALNEGLGRL